MRPIDSRIEKALFLLLIESAIPFQSDVSKILLEAIYNF
jgi:hypothetical protein